MCLNQVIVNERIVSLLIQNAKTINNNISRYKELVNQEKDKEGKTISYTDQSGKKQKWTPAIENEYNSLKENLKTIYQMPDARKVNFFNWPKDIVNESNIKETKADLLAVSIGNFHGIEISGIDPNLRLDVLKAVKDCGYAI